MTKPNSKIEDSEIRIAEIDEQAAAWWIKKSAGLSSRDHKLLSSWLEADPRHSAALDTIGSTNSALSDIPALERDRLVQQARGSLPVPKSFYRPFFTWTWWVGFLKLPQLSTALTSLAIIAIVAFSADYYFTRPIYTQSFATVRGVISKQLLPDGSTVTLDTDSAVEVTLYRHHRDVRLLQGQAMFQVSHDKASPFTVSAGQALVTVVGTRFSVRYLDDKVTVNVEEGHVRVAGVSPVKLNESFAQTIDLFAQQAVSVLGTGLITAVGNVSPDNIAPWREGRINFNNVRLEDAVSEFQRYTNTTINITDYKATNLHVSGSFQYRKLDSFLAVLPDVLPVKVSSTPDSIRISSK